MSCLPCGSRDRLWRGKGGGPKEIEFQTDCEPAKYWLSTMPSATWALVESSGLARGAPRYCALRDSAWAPVRHPVAEGSCGHAPGDGLKDQTVDPRRFQRLGLGRRPANRDAAGTDRCATTHTRSPCIELPRLGAMSTGVVVGLRQRCRGRVRRRGGAVRGTPHQAACRERRLSGRATRRAGDGAGLQPGIRRRRWPSLRIGCLEQGVI